MEWLLFYVILCHDNFGNSASSHTFYMDVERKMFPFYVDVKISQNLSINDETRSLKGGKVGVTFWRIDWQIVKLVNNGIHSP